MTARYNGLADWYDARFVVGTPRHLPSLPELLGPGSGPCLDLGCGTGRNFDTIRDSGRSVVGVDRSADPPAGRHAPHPAARVAERVPPPRADGRTHRGARRHARPPRPRHQGPAELTWSP